MHDWSAAVLAGGRGRRLDGRIKALVDVGGRSPLTRQVAALAPLGVTPRLIAPDPTPFAGLPYEVVTDVIAAGALGALYTAVVTSPTDYVLVMAGDLPFVTTSFIAALLARRHGADAVVPRPGGRWQPLCAVYHRDVAARLRVRIEAGRWRVTEALDDLRVAAFTATDLAAFDPDGRLLLNVNTPDDLRLAIELATLER